MNGVCVCVWGGLGGGEAGVCVARAGSGGRGWRDSKEKIRKLGPVNSDTQELTGHEEKPGRDAKLEIQTWASEYLPC